MKKIFISLLMVAAAMNAMAITFASKATLKLTSSNNESCEIIVAESDDLAAGLNNGYYALINMENREVAIYAIYEGNNYQQFATKSLADMALGVKTSAATEYTLTVSNVSGAKTLKLKIGDETIELTEGLSKALTLTPNQAAMAFGTLEPSAPAVSLCFEKNVLKINGHAGETLIVKNGADEIVPATVLGDTYTSPDFGALVPAETRLVVTLAGEDYQIDVNPHVDPLVLNP